MVSRPQLILDIAGVILSNLSPGLWEDFSILSGKSKDYLKKQFNTEIKNDLWTGRIKEEDFFKWIADSTQNIRREIAADLIKKHLYTLPSIDHLQSWSEIADIHLLSNHVQQWVEPLIKPYIAFLKSITISSSVGFCKPYRDIYDIVDSGLIGSNVLFIDDQEKNLITARSLGWNTLLADEGGLWIKEITKYLNAY